MKPTLRSTARFFLAAILPLAAHAFEPDVILDANTQADAASVELGGSGWFDVSSSANAFRGAAMHLNVSTPSHFARFHARLPRAGAYSVFVWHDGGTSQFGYDFTAQVTHADAVATSVVLNQASGNDGQWLLLGTFWFPGNDDGSNACKEAEVKITGGGNLKMSADAVRFARAAADVVLDSDSGGGAVAFFPASGDGAWSSVADKAGAAGNIRRSNGHNGTVASTASYTFAVPVSGDYDVSLWLPGASGSWLSGNLTPAASFQVEVQHPSVEGQDPPASTTATATLPAASEPERCS